MNRTKKVIRSSNIISLVNYYYYYNIRNIKYFINILLGKYTSYIIVNIKYIYFIFKKK